VKRDHAKVGYAYLYTGQYKKRGWTNKPWCHVLYDFCSPHWTILEGENPRILQKIRSPVFQCSRVHDVGQTLVVFPNKSEAYKLTMNAGSYKTNPQKPPAVGFPAKLVSFCISRNTKRNKFHVSRNKLVVSQNFAIKRNKLFRMLRYFTKQPVPQVS
jgi:hypothetical protein